MRLFLDTANLEEIKKACELGVIDGVTTNPSLIAKEGKRFDDVVNQICAMIDGPISAEAVSENATGMIEEAKSIAKMHKNVVVKIPMTGEGLKAVKACKELGIKTNVTLIFSANQALLAAKAGATYVSPFVGRIDDTTEYGMELVERIVSIYRNYNYATEVIVASVRNPLHVLEAAQMGADIATVPYSVLQQMIRHPLTDLGIQRFLEDWKKVPGR